MSKSNPLKIATIAVLILSSCVSSKKYDDLLKKKLRLDADFASAQDSLNAYKVKSKNQGQALDNLSTLSKKLKEDSASLADKLTRTQKLLDEQTATGDRLRKDYKDLLASYSAESNKLSSNLAKKEQQLLDMEKNLQIAKKQNDSLLTSLRERERKVNELQAILRKKDSAVVALKNTVSDALLSFKDKGLTVSVKNGKVYVSVSEQLLFKSGSTLVDDRGKEALKKLADALKNQTEVNVMVEGHTDDVQVSKNANTPFSDNWDLSVLRATEITRILIQGGINPKRLMPAGHGEFSPMAEGKTADARQKNRRTEIILTPKLDELFKILESN
ncbi:MAG: OmpA family protein [Cytophagales bacterium]|nr:OmpA family protein [Cytophagales bacterium]